MTDRYAVIGNPVAHSKSPGIHAEFARATGQLLEYGRIEAPAGGFAAAVARFAAEGGRGLNVTVPFKLDAFNLAHERSARARVAGACNTLKRDGTHWYGDNTDGAGLLRDLTVNRGVAIAGKDVLVLGAGGAARGIMLPLADAGPRTLCISNRTDARALQLARELAPHAHIDVLAAGQVAQRAFDVVINATSAGLGSDLAAPWPTTLFRRDAFAYDLIYADAPTMFLQFAMAAGVTRTADGLGMLIEQAAESFVLWRGVRPQTGAMIERMRPRRA